MNIIKQKLSQLFDVVSPQEQVKQTPLIQKTS
jgi:hypothetical protein